MLFMVIQVIGLIMMFPRSALWLAERIYGKLSATVNSALCKAEFPTDNNHDA